MEAVVAFAENILARGRDRYRADPTPLLADGIEARTGEHLRWGISPARRAVLSDLACQQNLLRMLTALTNLTGEPRYGEAAEAALRYHFEHLLDRSGLLQWGGHRFIDLETLAPAGPVDKGMVHELKNCFPFYEFLFELAPEVTARFIKAFWNAHIYDWDNLYMGRHGRYGLEVGAVWEHALVDPPVFRESTGLSFLNTGSDLIYAAGLLYRHRGERGALRWAKHLARQYVRARHPETGLGAYQFTQPQKKAETADDTKTASEYGDRAKRQFGPEFGAIALEGNVLFPRYGGSIYGENALIQLRLAAELGEEGAEFLEWTRQGLTSFARYAYDETTNTVKPMFTDGKDLTGYVLRRDGYYGPAGHALGRRQADGRFLLSFVRCFLLTRDDHLWRIAREIGRGNGLGDLGAAPGTDVRPLLGTGCADARALFAILDLYQATGCPDYPALAEAIGANIERATFHDGYFLPGPDYVYARLDAIEPLALLALAAAKTGRPEAVPVFLGGSGFIHGDYYFPDGTMRNIKDYQLYEERAGMGTPH